MASGVVFPHEFKDGPGNVASGVQVMENLEAVAGEGTYQAASVAKTIGTEYEASATRRTLVVVSVQLKPTSTEGSSVAFYVGTEKVGEVYESLLASGSTNAIVRQSCTFPVPAGKKWHAKQEAGSAEGLTASYCEF